MENSFRESSYMKKHLVATRPDHVLRGRATRLLLFLAALFFAVASPALADMATLTAARDNTLYEDDDGDISNGQGATMFAGSDDSGTRKRAVMYFDVAGSIPAGATIDSAVLTLHLSQTADPETRSNSLHALSAAWGEGASQASGGGGQGAAAQSGDATWLHTFYDGSLWTTPGGDFNSTPSAAVDVTTTVAFYNWSSANVTADVQNWLDSPGANFGWLLHGDESSAQTIKRFDARNHSNASFRPTLTIQYTPVPEPGGIALVLSGLAATLAYRSRSFARRRLGNATG
jgi:hypothetical protein